MSKKKGTMSPDNSSQIALFKGREIRKTIYNNEWWFVVEDIILALIDSRDPKQYLQRMKLRDHMTDLELIFKYAWRSCHNGNYTEKRCDWFCSC
jgi:prophage antirepressor-like protein